MVIISGDAPRVRTAQAADWALSRGVASLTTAELGDLLAAPVSQVPQRMASPKRRGEWVTPGRGLWVPVPPEFRGWGGPPASEIIAALMSHLRADYYIGWLAAAAAHGAAHQAPQVTHVAVSRLVRDRQVGRAVLRFHSRENMHALPVTKKMGRSGSYVVSTPEVTALDLASNISLSGGLDNAATVIADLVDEVGLDDEILAGLAHLFSDAAVRRVGWIVERFTAQRLDVMAAYVENRPCGPARLHPAFSLTGDLDERWRLRLNTAVEVE